MAAGELIDAEMARELEYLMKEFPDWKENHPDIYRAISQPVNTRREVNNGGASGYNDTSVGQTRRVVFDDERNQMSVPAAPSYSRYAQQRPPVGPRTSTTKDHYKWWDADPSPPFCELPTFSNYLIYPGRGRHFQTTTQAFFKGEPGFRPPAIKPRDDESLELLGITSRGGYSVDTKTTTGQAFQSYRDARPAEKIDRTPADTSYITRYVDASDRMQMSPPNNRSTTYRTMFNHADVPKFDGKSVTQETYRPWPISQRQPYGDQHESPFAPSQSRFDGRTTNSLTYRGVQLPAPGADRIQSAGVMTRPHDGAAPRSLLEVPDAQPRDFDTAYKTDFDRPNTIRLLNKLQALALLRELRERKRKRDAALPAQSTTVEATVTKTKSKGTKTKSPTRRGNVTAVRAS